MSKIKSRHVFTSESVSEGHPDKICDQISDAVLDECLMQDPESRVACENLTTTNLIVMSGEITTKASVDWEKIARKVVSDIGYTHDDIGFSASEATVLKYIHKQSEDISMGVTAETSQSKEQGAGDQGMMFGYATDETEELMPAPIIFSHKIMKRLADLRHAGKTPFLRPDAKSQVSVLYDNGKPVSVETIVVSHQHSPDMKISKLEELVRKIAQEVIPQELFNKNIKYFINPTGNFIIGGPNGDTGLTGRKIIVDTYGGVGCHGGGAFSGKDPSKVDRSAAYMCRYAAKNIVAAKLANKCEIQVAYAIGVAHPLSLNVETFGTGIIPDSKLSDIIQNSGIFDFRPAEIIKTLNLKYPNKTEWNYLQTAAYGHFGRAQFPWEKTNKINELLKII